MTFKSALGITLFSSMLTISGAVNAAGPDPRSLGTFKDWNAYTWVEGGQKVCYMLSRPTKSLPTNVRRGDIYMMVTYRPKSRSKEEVSHITGYTYKNKSVVDVTIDKRKFKLATDNDVAWVPEGESDAKLIKAMRGGSRMIVKGTSSRGTLTTDTYSLQGFTAAHKQIRKSCS
ncbi:invasion associated locus B family protein [Sneathiella glossodoripedis]|uniref:invasion associated locus B family protein n=1 Tax=Sneathiella glossodoripedis TaxID=418853 RepID=UPI0019006181|nr:invasion associated locus B family protein [Sneathiella glossodoripedis]